MHTAYALRTRKNGRQDKRFTSRSMDERLADHNQLVAGSRNTTEQIAVV